MTYQLKHKTINAVYDELRYCTDVEHQAEMAYLDAKLTVELLEANAIYDGIEGKNEAQRKAALSQMFPDERHALDVANKQLALAKHNAHLAQLEERRIRLHLRLRELEHTT